MNDYYKDYDNVESLLEDISKTCHKSWECETRSSRKDDSERASWYGATFEQAKDLASYGWPEGLKDITDKLSVIKTTGRGREVIKSVAGSNPDIGRFIAGMPDCMNRRIISEASRKPCLDIVLNASYSLNVKSSHIMNYGAAIASVIDELESTGYSISFKAGALTKCYRASGEPKAGFSVMLKQQGEAMDIGRLVYFIAHPSFLRRLFFSYIEVYVPYADIGSGYGSIDDLPKNLQGDLYFGKSNDLTLCETLEGARQVVRGIVERQMPDLLDKAD